MLPGADVRIEPGLIEMIQSGTVLTLGDHGRHVLLELPHELYIPLERLLDDLHAGGMREFCRTPSGTRDCCGTRRPLPRSSKPAA